MADPTIPVEQYDKTFLEESVFGSIYIQLGYSEVDISATSKIEFESDITVLINSALSTLYQLGLTFPDNYRITSLEQKWSDFIPNSKFDFIKEYVYISVRLVFDPPQNSYLVTAYKERKKELEWRLAVLLGSPNSYKEAVTE